MAEKATQTTPSEYKQTEVGLIPGDWEIKKCGELGSFYKGKGISSKDLVSDGLPCIMYGDIYVKFDTKFSNPDFRITKQTAANSSLAKTGDLFFTGSGETAEEIGKCVVYQGSDDIYIGGDIIALTPNSNNDSLFLAYMQNSKMLLSQKTNLGQGHTVVHIYTEHIKSLKTPLPPTKTEQTAIASVLFDVDALIEKLEKLVAKKRAIKQGVMQELLTGKRRLHGFGGEWKVEKLGEIFDFKQGVQCPVEKQFFTHNEGLKRFIRIIDLTQPEELPRFISDPGSSHHIFTNDLFMVRYGAPGLLGFGYEAVVANNLFRLLPKRKINTHFFYYLLFFKNSDITQISSSTTMAALNFAALKELELNYPLDIEEQIKIVSIFRDMDAEIELLEQKLDKYKMLKQGMMQVLLTGKIRLI